MLETQDINVSAYHFYIKNHFVIGAVDIMLYSNLSTAIKVQDSLRRNSLIVF